MALRAVEASDFDFLWKLVNDAESTIRWRFRGTSPSPQELQALLWNGVLSQFIVTGADSGRAVGLLTAFDTDLANGVTHLSILLEERARGRGWPLEAVPLFLDHLFANWPLRKVYLETIEFNAITFRRGVARIFEEEGRLREHEHYLGRYWDVFIMALTRARWNEVRASYTTLLASANGASRESAS
ncbi:MAG: GNAT family N-acetyltransferase [Acidimicrobiales bacterium]